jgi:hypothetical protein
MAKVTRKLPQRTIGKKAAVRHLIHAAIRMTMANEDAFAIHLLAQSPDKLLIDLSKPYWEGVGVGLGRIPAPGIQIPFLRTSSRDFQFFQTC